MLSGAVVMMADLDRVAVTDASGRYVFRGVAAGPQHISVRSIGYAPRTLHALVPRAGMLEINVALRAEPIPLRALDVRPRVAVRGSEAEAAPSFPDRVISIAAVRNHPLLAEPDVLQSLSGGEVVLRPESPSGVNIRGGAADQTAYLLDGVPILSPYHAAGTFSAWNPDAISSLQLFSAAPSPALPDVLSGVVDATTRTPGADFRMQGSFSSTQARATVDGPLGSGAGYLLSLRSGFPGYPLSEKEASYLRAETGDLIAKIEARVFGGRARLLGYDNENELNAKAVAEPEDPQRSDTRRNTFQWRSRSVGVDWSGRLGTVDVNVRGWQARGAADASWSDRHVLASQRRDVGLLASATHNTT
ncbi:MAG: carboxypeptidase regulatory-like domain-containing protein, partial [Longimicrobiales bacterium]